MSAKCAIFFIDEDQRVTWKDIGEKKDIERRAKRAGAKVTHLQLASQFRCSGSDGYLAWLDDTLGIRETANPELDVAEFDFRVFDSPEELRKVIVEKNAARNKARMVAGYCWDWKSKKDAQGGRRRDPGAWVRDAVEPDAGRRAVDHGAGVGDADRLHPHLPGARGGLHRRGRGAGPGGAGWEGRDASGKAVEAGPVDQGVQEAMLETDPEGAKQKADLHHQEHVPDADDARDEGVLRVLHG